MKKPVLVLGGGIAGIQAAGDLADMGVPVFLAEKSPSVGGRMAQLDKTFPTNDCSACILAPKITSCVGNPLVKTLTLTELVALKGEAPDFTAVLRRKARYVDETLCVGCGACERVCPVERKNGFDMELGIRHAIYKPSAQAVPNKVCIEKNGVSPCRRACPAGVNIHAVAALSARGKFEDALRVLRETTFLSGVLGTVCPRPCEGGCHRGLAGGAVALGELERFAALNGRNAKPRLPPVRPGDEVAVLGAGPEGLSCAYQLRRAGYHVTVYEKSGCSGGSLWEYVEAGELDAALLTEELDLLARWGIEVRCGVPATEMEETAAFLARGCRAVYLSAGILDCLKSPGPSKGTNEPCKTKLPGVFASDAGAEQGLAWDVARGNRAAAALRSYLEGTALLPDGLPAGTPVSEVDFSPALGTKPNRPGKRSIETPEEARREAGRCLDCSVCCECGLCERVCSRGAILRRQTDETIELPVSAVIVAAGARPSAEFPDAYGYGVYPDVVTNLEFERMLSASGPQGGHVRLRSADREPERIAFLQCAGSRDEPAGCGYCSATCCMSSVKEAVVAREHLPGISGLDIFYMDMRACGKDFDRYVASARDKYGVGMIRGRVSAVARSPETGALRVRYCGEDERVAEAEYSMVVLSVGMRQEDGLAGLFSRLGVKTDRYGFAWASETGAPETSRPGILVCGTAAGPKDIPETVVEAGAAAALAYRFADTVWEDTGDLFPQREQIPQRDTDREPLRIGIFVCHCGSNIAGYVDVKEVARAAAGLPHVAYTGDLLYACSEDAQNSIRACVRKHRLSRVVVASCSPRTHEPLFQNVLEQEGLNPHLLTMANIRDQCTWVHMEERQSATRKAIDLVRMAAARVARAKPLLRQRIEVERSVLVLGGGAAGMAAALSLAGMKVRVFLVEQTQALGGSAARLYASCAGRPLGDSIAGMIRRCEESPMIEVRYGSRVKSIEGSIGSYATVIATPEGDAVLRHGAVIVATGAREAGPESYLYGQSPAVFTQMELEEAITRGQARVTGARRVAMIQCAGSRSGDRPYCSRVCCVQALRNALRLKEARPETEITVFYRDLRTYGQNEDWYRRARAAGVRFVRYEPERSPEVREDEDGLAVRFFDPPSNRHYSWRADILAVSGAVAPDLEENRRIAQLLKVPLNQDGFFLEAHVKLRPVEFATDGVYVCGLAHAPKTLKESILQGRAAAARAAAVVMKSGLYAEGTVAGVDESACAGCGACERVCAFQAISLRPTRQGRGLAAVVNPVLCKGCGTCSAACRCGAVTLGGCSDRQTLGELEALLRTREVI